MKITVRNKTVSKRSSPHKYKVVLSRKDILAAFEMIVEKDPGDSAVYLFTHRSNDYEIRAKRKARGVVFDWGKPGTFFAPLGYHNSNRPTPAMIKHALDGYDAGKKQG